MSFDPTIADRHAAAQRDMLRRTFLRQTTLGLGAAALGGLLGSSRQGGGAFAADVDPALLASRGVVNPLHFAPKAKRVIFLCMAGGPSQIELFDEKPKLAEMDGKPMPESFTAGQPIAQLQGKELTCWGSRAKFARHGQSGQNISEFLPRIAGLADDICVIRSMQTEQINHDPAHTFMNTGTAISGRPSMGSWFTYGLGSESQELPGFVVLVSRMPGRSPQPIASRQWHSGFLPSKFQGVPFHSTGDPVHYVGNPPGVSAQGEKNVIDAVIKLNKIADAASPNPEIATRIAQYELAFRMQTSVPAVSNIADEPQHVLDAYGVKSADGSFGYNCLLARRLAERGVRFIQLYHRDWDHHDNLAKWMPVACESADGPTAALINDLKARDMLKETLVVWGGEFGRTPMAQNKSKEAEVGRDHHIRGFSMWLVGGGVKPGVSYGNTDEFGYNAVDKPVHVHDLHATMLHLLGIDHERLTYRYQGRDFRLTDVAGNVVKDILA